MTKHKFTVTAARGMLPLLETELKQIGIKQYKTEAGSIRFTGSLSGLFMVTRRGQSANANRTLYRRND